MAEEFNNSMLAVAGNFLKELNVPFTKSVFKKKLENNPYFPSLFSLSHVLNEYNVENKGLQIEPEQLEELPLPFLAYYKIKETGSRDFVNVTRMAGNAITYYYGKERTITKEEFLAGWVQNTVLIAERTENSKEKEYEQNKKVELKNKSRTYWLLLGYGLFIVLALYNYIRVYDNIIESVSLLLFSLAGLTVSILLLVYEVDRSNVFVKSICTGGEKTNCDAVLGSKAARLFGISWAEVGFFYFSAFTLFLLLPVISFPEKIPYLSYASVLSAAYIPFSIYYQYKVVKQWCRLCLLIQATLLLNLVWAIGFGAFSLVLSYASIFLFTGTILAPIVIWYTLKPILLKAKDKNKYEAAYKRLYSRKDVFELTLGDRETAPDGWQNMGIHKGNPNAENIILKVCSPLCKHCFTSHVLFNEILKAND
ncbi:MAG TPA: vitamin K epoxide reductase family protein, partial [Bacteroidia bacterium]|nr:vitamin K epoxide reductase family protein [Bacteroidia bacterium]